MDHSDSQADNLFPRRRKRKSRRLPGWDELWELRFAELREFYEIHGHTRVPARWRRNVSLGRWLAYQRQQCRRGLLDPVHQKRLQELEVEWSIPEPTVEEYDLYMDKMLARLVAYRDRYGHAGVTEERDPVLTGWILCQRRYFKEGTMKNYRRERMDAAGFPWEAVDASWEEKFARLKAFKERFGHVRVPCEWENDKPLGRWVEHQRLLHRRGLLREDYRCRLEALGFPGERRIQKKSA